MVPNAIGEAKLLRWTVSLWMRWLKSSVLRVGGMYGETSILLLYLESRRVIFIMFESIKSMDLFLSVLSEVSLFCLDI